MLQAEGVELIANYQLISSWSKWGSWGVLEYQQQPIQEAPKYRALIDWMAANPVANNAVDRIRGLRPGQLDVYTDGCYIYTLESSRPYIQGEGDWQPVTNWMGRTGQNRVESLPVTFDSETRWFRIRMQATGSGQNVASQSFSPAQVRAWKQERFQ